MGISTYEENGIKYYKVYVHVRSPVDRTKRAQRTATRIKTEAEARREEKKLLQEATREVQKMEGIGLTWAEVVHLWSKEYLSGKLMKRVGRNTSLEYVGVIEKWTQRWMKRPVSELSRADGRELIIRMEKAGLSRNYQKKIKNIVNSCFE